MRWLVGFLVAANILIFVITQWNPRAPVDTNVSERTERGNLRLLSELDGETSGMRATDSSPDSGKKPMDGLANRDRGRAGLKGRGSGSGDPSPDGTEDPEPVLDPAGARPALSEICGSLGPIESEEEARALAARIEADGIEVSLDHRNRRTPYRYVVLGLPSDGTEADELLTQMQKAGLTDLQRLPPGDLANGISLGTFSTLKNAETRQQEALRLGFETEIITDYEQVDEYWADYRYDVPEKAVSIAGLLQDMPGLGVRNVVCSQIVRD